MDKEFVEKLLALYPGFFKVYGPYVDKNNDNRSIIQLFNNPDDRRTVSWPKAMMEVKLGRLLTDDEQVDHVDEDPTNNNYDNFQILTRIENVDKSVWMNGRQQKYFVGTCPLCGNEFTKKLNNVKGNLKKGRGGPYCSRSCAGKVNQKIRPYSPIGSRQET